MIRAHVRSLPIPFTWGIQANPHCYRGLKSVKSPFMLTAEKYPPNPQPLSPVKRARGDLADYRSFLCFRLRRGKGRVRGELTRFCAISLMCLCKNQSSIFKKWETLPDERRTPAKTHHLCQRL